MGHHGRTFLFNIPLADIHYWSVFDNGAEMARPDTAGVEGGEVRPYFEIKLNLRDGWVGDCRCSFQFDENDLKETTGKYKFRDR